MSVEGLVGVLAENWIDLGIALFLVIFAVQGYLRGFALWLADLAGLAVAILVAFRWFPVVGDQIGAWLGFPDRINSVLGFLAVFVAVQVAVSIVVALIWRVLQVARPVYPLWMANRMLGIPLAVAFAVISLSLLMALFLRLPIDAEAKDVVHRSTLAQAFQVDLDAIPGEWRELLVPPEAQRLFTNRLLHADDTVELPFTVEGTVAPAREEQLLDLVNQERVAHGLAPLVFDSRLRDIARRHSDDMLRRGYFSHISPEGVSPADRAIAAGYHFTILGENIALAPTVAIAHRGLMDSPGHRENIMSPEFTRIGIGIVDAGFDGLMVTQLFAR